MRKYAHDLSVRRTKQCFCVWSGFRSRRFFLKIVKVVYVFFVSVQVCSCVHKLGGGLACVEVFVMVGFFFGKQ